MNMKEFLIMYDNNNNNNILHQHVMHTSNILLSSSNLFSLLHFHTFFLHSSSALGEKNYHN